jgi:hypothetical protein
MRADYTTKLTADNFYPGIDVVQALAIAATKFVNSF